MDAVYELSFKVQGSVFAALSNVKTSDELHPDKPIVLMLHGWLDNAASFSGLFEYLDDYQVLALDLPGHGRSSHRSSDAHYHLMDYVQDVHALVLHQGWQNIVLVGHSLGGIIGHMYAACFGELVSHFLCIESSGPLTEPADTSAKQLRASIESRIRSEQKQIKQPESFERVIAARLAVSDLREQDAELIMRRNLRFLEGGTLEWSTDKRLRTLSSLRMTPEQAQNIIQHITCPTLIILGSEGFEKLKVNLENRKNWYKNYRLETIPGGHHCHMAQAKKVSELLNQLLQQ